MVKNSVKDIKAMVKAKEEKKRAYWWLAHFDSLEDLIDRIESYFESLITSEPNPNDPEWWYITRNKIPSLPWLAKHLKTTREVLKEYCKHEEYREAIRAAKTEIESRIVDLANEWRMNPSWAKFYLKNCDWWEDVINNKNTDEKTTNYNINIVSPAPLKDKEIEKAEVIDAD